MARSLNPEEAEVFKTAISPELTFSLEQQSSLEDLLERRDAEFELMPESEFWFACHFPDARNS